MDLSKGKQKAIALFETAAKLARFLGISESAVSQWYHVPEGHLEILKKATGVKKHAFRPDLFDEDDNPIKGKTEL